ncbi:MAG: IspD/TarI family cytidylyltransferase [Clostridia bacterium]|nr:IspD/TarI family cytidylyltransferase [Clostridia bacterium]
MRSRRNKIGLLLLAAGSASRMGEEKLLMRFGGKTPIAHCAAAFASCETRFDAVAVTVSDSTRAEAESAFPAAVLVAGGESRTASVRNGLGVLADVDIVVIHDAARCLVTKEIIDASVQSAIEHGSGVAAIPARDTVRFCGEVIERENVMLAQTPQTFAFARIKAAYAHGFAATDDAAHYAMAGYDVCFSPGSIQNQKLTVPGDIPFFAAFLGERT